MVKTALAMFVIGGMAMWGQAQTDSPAAAEKARVDRAEAYYHYALACWYAQNGRGNPEYAKKATDSYKAAVKADPQAQMPSYRPSLIFPLSVLPGAPRGNSK
jgi:hypothetical protein